MKFEIGQEIKSNYHGIAGELKDINATGFMGYPEITVAYETAALGTYDDLRSVRTTFVVTQSSDWEIV